MRDELTFIDLPEEIRLNILSYYDFPMYRHCTDVHGDSCVWEDTMDTTEDEDGAHWERALHLPSRVIQLLFGHFSTHVDYGTEKNVFLMFPNVMIAHCCIVHMETILPNCLKSIRTESIIRSNLSRVHSNLHKSLKRLEVVDFRGMITHKRWDQLQYLKTSSRIPTELNRITDQMLPNLIELSVSRAIVKVQDPFSMLTKLEFVDLFVALDQISLVNIINSPNLKVLKFYESRVDFSQVPNGITNSTLHHLEVADGKAESLLRVTNIFLNLQTLLLESTLSDNDIRQILGPDCHCVKHGTLKHLDLHFNYGLAGVLADEKGLGGYVGLVSCNMDQTSVPLLDQCNFYEKSKNINSVSLHDPSDTRDSHNLEEVFSGRFTFFQSLSELNIGTAGLVISDHIASVLANIKSLHSLWLDQKQISSKAVAVLFSSETLRLLSLEQCEIQDDVLFTDEYLNNRTITDLNVAHNMITSMGVNQIFATINSHGIRRLDLTNNPFELTLDKAMRFAETNQTLQELKILYLQSDISEEVCHFFNYECHTCDVYIN